MYVYNKDWPGDCEVHSFCKTNVKNSLCDRHLWYDRSMHAATVIMAPPNTLEAYIPGGPTWQKYDYILVQHRTKWS